MNYVDLLGEESSIKHQFTTINAKNKINYVKKKTIRIKIKFILKWTKKKKEKIQKLNNWQAIYRLCLQYQHQPTTNKINYKKKKNYLCEIVFVMGSKYFCTFLSLIGLSYKFVMDAGRKRNIK